VENLNPSLRCGCRQNRCHTRITLSWLTASFRAVRSQSASRRADQCLTPCACSDSGGGDTVAARISHTAASVCTVTGPPPRRASSSPASPDSAYWLRHLTTVGSLQPTIAAISGLVFPSTASSTIQARSAPRTGHPGPSPSAATQPGQRPAP
jgi:hypothetical protein